MIPSDWLGKKEVESCYSLLDKVFPTCGFDDFTDGLFKNSHSDSYARGQENQHHFILRQLCFQPGHRVLDVGCGNGSLLRYIEGQPGEAVGITISPQQLERCRVMGLNVHLLDYRKLSSALELHSFDGIVANGSIEHFVQARDAASGHGDAIYRNFFYLCHQLLKPNSPSRRLVTTCIHFGNVSLNPFEVLGSPLLKKWGSDSFYYAWLAKCYGGFYPYSGQLIRSADPFFELEHECDGTRDYELTSEIWLKEIRRRLFDPREGWSLWGPILRYCLRAPFHGGRMLLGLLIFQSWQWQFRGQKPPMQLLRQTWVPRFPAS